MTANRRNRMKGAMLLLALWVAPRVSARGDDKPWQDIHRRLRDGVVVVTNSPIVGQATLGAGFLSRSRRLVVTSYHVVEGARSIGIQFSKGEMLGCSRVFLDRPHDLAVLELDQDAPAYAPELPLAVDPDSVANAAYPHEVLVIGHPLRLKWSPIVGQAAAVRLPGDFVDSPKYLAPDTVLLQLGIGATSGASGAPVIDLAGDVIGYYMGGPDKGVYNINCCVAQKYIHEARVEGSGEMRNLAHAASRGKDSFTQGAPAYEGEAELQHHGDDRQLDFRSVNLGEVKAGEVLRRFFVLWPGDGREAAYRRVVNDQPVYQVVNPAFGTGLLVPQGFVYNERYDPDTASYTCVIRRPSSAFFVRLYHRTLPVDMTPADEVPLLKNHASSFVGRELGLEIVTSESLVRAPMQVVLGPRTTAAADRDPDFPGLSLTGEYIAPLADKIYNFHFATSPTKHLFSAYGMIFPGLATSTPDGLQELAEISFIVESVYDMSVDLDFQKSVLRSRMYRLLGYRSKGSGHSLGPNENYAANVGIFYEQVRYQDGTFGARLTRDPSPGSPAAQLQLEPGDIVYDLDGQRFRHPSDVLGHRDQTTVRFINVRTNRSQDATVYIGVVARPPGNGNSGLNPGEVYAANLGVYYEQVPYEDGTFGVKLTRFPVAGTPAAQLQFEPGDTVFEMDGLRFRQPSDVLGHHQWTPLRFVNVRTDQSQAARVFIP